MAWGRLSCGVGLGLWLSTWVSMIDGLAPFLMSYPLMVGGMWLITRRAGNDSAS